MRLQRIPLKTICMQNSKTTGGLVVAVMADELAALEAEHDRLVAEVERMRGVVTEAVEALRQMPGVGMSGLLGDRVQRALDNAYADWVVHSEVSDRVFDAIRALVGLTSPTDGGA